MRVRIQTPDTSTNAWGNRVGQSAVRRPRAWGSVVITLQLLVVRFV